ncbi:BECN1 family protein [Megaselia abdita]
MEKTVVVNFACQNCFQPIVLDESMNNLSVHHLAELALPISNNYENPMSDSTPGFTLVTTDGKEANTLSAELKRKSELYDYISQNSTIDHPLCDECVDWLLEQMERQLKIAEHEHNEYSEYLKKLENSEDFIPNIDKLAKELDDLENQEKVLLSELEKLQIDEDDLKKSIEVEENEQKSLLNQEKSYWLKYTKHKKDLMVIEDDNRSLKCQIEYAENLLEKLKDTNVFNITFHIWHSGHFGTINNFRLGRLPSAPVDWSEINAAWGQTSLLINALARKIDLTFKKYKIVPFGNHSYVDVLGENKELPLYCTGGFKFLWDTKFDAAMVAFLECLTQFQEEIKKRDTEFRLPYDMEKGKIIDPSTGISYSINRKSIKVWLIEIQNY